MPLLPLDDDDTLESNMQFTPLEVSIELTLDFASMLLCTCYSLD
jgi:hypothetical protein